MGQLDITDRQPAMPERAFMERETPVTVSDVLVLLAGHDALPPENAAEASRRHARPALGKATEIWTRSSDAKACALSDQPKKNDQKKDHRNVVLILDFPAGCRLQFQNRLFSRCAARVGLTAAWFGAKIAGPKTK